MIKLKLTKVLASIIAVVSLLSLNPIGVSAEWKQDSNGWWYREGCSYSTGWRQIDGKWYYFYNNGYMAHDTTIDKYYLDTSGAWANSEITLIQAEEILKSNSNTSKMLSDPGSSYMYTPNDNYVSSSLRDKYYIFTYVDGAGDMTDRNTCVDKITGSVYIATPDGAMQILK